MLNACYIYYSRQVTINFVHSKAMLQRLYDHVSQQGNVDVMNHGLNYTLFIELLDHVAQNCVYSTRNVYGAVSRVRTMFHMMNSSRGRIKLSKGTNASIIPPLTGLDSTDPSLYRASPATQARGRSRTYRQSRSNPNSPAVPSERRKVLERKSSSSAPTTPEQPTSLANTPPSSRGAGQKKARLHNAASSAEPTVSSSSSRTSQNGHPRLGGKPDWV